MRSAVNELPCPEIALHEVVHFEGATFTSYAVRQPGAVLWSGWCRATLAGSEIAILEVDGFADPRDAVQDARLRVAAEVVVRMEERDAARELWGSPALTVPSLELSVN